MRIFLACTLWARLRGLKGRSTFKDALLLAPCNDIHTFGMKAPIDVAFIGSGGEVLAVCRGLVPRRRMRCRGAEAVLERFSAETPWLEPGETLALKSCNEQRRDDERWKEKED